MASRLSEPELLDLFHRLFPQGFAGDDVLVELAPGGWESSPLRRASHPTFEQWQAERIAIFRNMEELSRAIGRKGGKGEPPPAAAPDPTLEDSRRDFTESPVDPHAECIGIVGAVAWEIFSDNHRVVASDGREVDLGSWRASSCFLSEFADGAESNRVEVFGDCMRFYMGLLWIRERCDYGAVYRLAFRRMKREGLDWRYAMPRIHVFRIDRDASDRTPLHDYDPSTSFAREQERKAEDEEFAGMQAGLDETDEKAREEARAAPPPAIVEAYRSVFGRWPEGWPP